MYDYILDKSEDGIKNFIPIIKELMQKQVEEADKYVGLATTAENERMIRLIIKRIHLDWSARNRAAFQRFTSINIVDCSMFFFFAVKNGETAIPLSEYRGLEKPYVVLRADLTEGLRKLLDFLSPFITKYELEDIQDDEKSKIGDANIKF